MLSYSRKNRAKKLCNLSTMCYYKLFACGIMADPSSWSDIKIFSCPCRLGLNFLKQFFEHLASTFSRSPHSLSTSYLPCLSLLQTVNKNFTLASLKKRARIYMELLNISNASYRHIVSAYNNSSFLDFYHSDAWKKSFILLQLYEAFPPLVDATCFPWFTNGLK